MTTSLSKSTIPTYDPDDTYTSPRIVRPRAEEPTALRHTETSFLLKLNYICDAFAQIISKAPRVRPEARVNYENSRGSLNIGDWSAQSGDWQSPRPPPKVKFEEAQKALVRDRGEFRFRFLLYSCCR